MSLYEAVHEAWSNAWEGGYKDFLLEEDDESIAYDMMDYDAYVEKFARGDLMAVTQLVSVVRKEYTNG